MHILILLALRAQPRGCTEGSRFEDCEQYIQCVADPPNCTELVIKGLDGTIPSAIGNLTALTNLVIETYDMSGTIPETIGLLTMLKILRLATAPKLGDSGPGRLSGTMPESISKLTALRSLDLQSNSLSGTLAASVSKLTLLNTLHLANNFFTAVGVSICTIQDQLNSCDLSGNDIPGTYNAKGGKMNCPDCLNFGNCNKHNQGHGGDQPIFPNNVCNFTHSSCTCVAPSSTPAPTVTPTKSSHVVHRSEPIETYTLCVVLIVLMSVGALFILVAVVVYESIAVSRHACREWNMHETPYTEAVKHALTYRYRYAQRATAESTDCSIDSVQAGSTLEAPFLFNVAVQGGEEGAYANVFLPPMHYGKKMPQPPRREVRNEVVVLRNGGSITY